MYKNYRRRYRKAKKDFKKLSAPTAKAVKAIAKRTAGTMIETKYAQSSTGLQTIYASATAAGSYWKDVTASISQNTGDFNNRIGDKIRLQSMQLNYSIFMLPANTANISNVVRVMVVQYHRNDNAPLSTEMLRTTDMTGSAYYSAYSFFNRDYKKYYRVLYDKRHLITTITGTGAGGTSQNYPVSNVRHDHKCVINLQKSARIVQYSAGGTQAINPVFVFAIGDQATASVNPQVAINWNVLYKDA